MRRFIKPILVITVLLGIILAIICNSAYDKKYDAYYKSKANVYMWDHLHAGTLLVEVTIDTKQTEYNSLGTDISYKHTCNGVPISSGDTIRARSQLSFDTTITEHDSIDDVGSTGAVLSLLSPPYTVSKTVSCKVKENGGRRYADAYAVWDITYSVSPVIDLDVGFWEVVFS